jgi:hypothetical protein
MFIITQLKQSRYRHTLCLHILHVWLIVAIIKYVYGVFTITFPSVERHLCTLLYATLS